MRTHNCQCCCPSAWKPSSVTPYRQILYSTSTLWSRSGNRLAVNYRKLKFNAQYLGDTASLFQLQFSRTLNRPLEMCCHVSLTIMEIVVVRRAWRTYRSEIIPTFPVPGDSIFSAKGPLNWTEWEALRKFGDWSNSGEHCLDCGRNVFS